VPARPLPTPRFWTVLGALALLACPASAGPPGADIWKYDEVHLTNGQVFRGLILEHKLDGIRLRQITRKPGRATLTNVMIFTPREVHRVVKLPPKERAQLEKRLKRLYAEREALAENLKALNSGKEPVADDLMNFRAVPWEAGGKALLYESNYFRLVSDARPELVRLTAIHLEQIHDAYAHALPPRTTGEEGGKAGEGRTRPPRPTILLARSWESYQKLAQKRHLDLINPAYYDPSRREIVCGCDLGRLGDELEKARHNHETLYKELTRRKNQLRAIYGEGVPKEFLSPIDEVHKKIRAAEIRNQARFREARLLLFRRLYHEAFHAYLDGFVYPEGGVPRWLNEGLAQIFETSIVEAGTLRVGHADGERVRAVRSALADDTLLPLTDLLRSTPKDFLVAHTGMARDRQASDRHYLASWALAFHLTFDRKLLGTRGLDEYVRSLKGGTDSVAAFQTLVGQPLPEFEEAFHRSLEGLRPDRGP
jgi:hypothetical protein